MENLHLVDIIEFIMHTPATGEIALLVAVLMVIYKVIQIWNEETK